jgi:phosphatidate cytidylyltransferase
VTRVASGAVLALLAIAVVWFAPPLVFQLVAVVLLAAATRELVALARSGGLEVAAWLSIAGALSTLVAFVRAASGRGEGTSLEIVLLGQLLAVGAATLSAWRGGPNALAIAAATFFPSLYLAMPIGALVVLREHEGPAILFLLMLTVMVSDVAQYYSGRLTGRRPLAPTVSPKKTLEGAIGGFAAGALVPVVAGAWWLPQVPVGLRGLLGAGIVTAGIAGDLFESMLKRSAGVKDSSALIPGHGGVLDRIDALLFAAPLYYTVLQYV